MQLRCFMSSTLMHGICVSGPCTVFAVIHALYYRPAAELYANLQTGYMHIHLWQQDQDAIRDGHHAYMIVAGPVDDSKMKSVVEPSTVPSQQQSQLGGGSTR